MQSPAAPPVVAEAADVLSDQLRVHLTRLSKILKPHLSELDRRFRLRLRPRRYDPRQLKALCDITPGAAARIFAATRTSSQAPAAFFEQVEYSGRRLARLNVPPGAIVRALREYDKVLDPLLRQLLPAEYAHLRWAREQLHFCVILTLNNAFYNVREAETQAFYDLFRAELQAKNLNELLQLFLDTLTKTCRAQVGRLVLLDHDLQTCTAFAATPNGGSPQPERLPPSLLRSLARARYIENGDANERLILDPLLWGRCQSYWSIPLLAGNKLAGIMQFGFSTRYRWLTRELQLLDAAAERCLLAAEKAHLVEQLRAREKQIRELSEHLVEVEEEERRRISRELHDETGQSLLYIRLQLELLEKLVPPSLAGALAKIHETREVAERTITEVRRIIAALSPAVLEQLGLAAALRQLTSRFRRLFPGRVRLHISAGLCEVPRQAQVIVYRLAQECYNNITKHSSASHVNIRLHSTDQYLELSVEDDGRGFDVDAALRKRDSFGLLGMMERVSLLGGKFHIDSQPGQGTRISIQLPMQKSLAGAEKATRE